jgi:hypothetical protein
MPYLPEHWLTSRLEDDTTDSLFKGAFGNPFIATNLEANRGSAPRRSLGSLALLIVTSVPFIERRHCGIVGCSTALTFCTAMHLCIAMDKLSYFALSSLRPKTASVSLTICK